MQLQPSTEIGYDRCSERRTVLIRRQGRGPMSPNRISIPNMPSILTLGHLDHDLIPPKGCVSDV